MSDHKPRKHLCLDSMIQLICDCFISIPDHRPNHCEDKISLLDTLMSAFAMMHLKYPSLLEFDRERETQELQFNLKHLYRVQGKIPCDTYMRTTLDPVDPRVMRAPFKLLFNEVQRGAGLKGFRFSCGDLKDHYLLAIDGTGLYYSGRCRCQECCVKNEGKANEAYYHQMLAGCIVHPDKEVVLPLAPEPIVHQDGTTKNDCEKNALKRFLSDVKRDHPYLKLVIVLDGLYADGPTIRLIKSYGWHFIIVAKDDNHASLIEATDELDQQDGVKRLEVSDRNGVKHWCRYANEVPLNKTEPVEIVNVLDYVETDKKGKRHTWSWITDIPLTEETVLQVAEGGRCRWHIENETFNTLKNQGYELEHNYGHGEQHLATNLAYLTFLAFLVDQIQQLCCPIFQEALKRRARGTRTYLWKLILRYFLSWLIESWEELFQAVVHGTTARKIQLDTS